MNGFEKKKRQTRERILSSARELFSQNGFTRTSLNDIARQAEVSHVTIYNHFGNKGALIREVLLGLIMKSLEKTKAVFQDDSIHFLQKIERIAGGKAEYNSLYDGQLMNRTVLLDPEMEHLTNMMLREEINILYEELVRQGKREGYIDPRISTQAVILYFEILRRGGLASADLLESADITTQLIMDLNRLMLYGLVRETKTEEG